MHRHWRHSAACHRIGAAKQERRDCASVLTARRALSAILCAIITMMETATLWQQILATPGDEELKTRYIQALAEAGDPRVEVFRLAEQLRRFPGYYVQHEELSRRYESSLAPWRDDLAASAAHWQAEITFVEGWPGQITIAAADFLRYAAEIIAAIPVRHLNLTAVNDATGVFNVAPFEQIASLDGSRQPWSTEAIEALASSVHLSSLRWLDLSRTGITEGEVAILAASPHLRGLAHLDLQHNPSRDPVDAAEGCGVDGFSGYIVPESIYLPDFGRELEARYGRIPWLHALAYYMETHPPSRYRF